MRFHGVAFASLFLALAFTSVKSAHATSIVNNGSFQTGDFTGWTANPNSSFPWQVEGAPGNFFADTGCVGQECITGTTSQQAYLYQDLTTTAGNSYTLGFTFSNEGTPSELEVLFGSTVAIDLLNVNTGGSVDYSVNGLVASSSITRLEFLGREDPSFMSVTNISVTDNGPASTSPIPEPGTVGMVGTGVLGLLGAVRRKLSV